MTTSIVNNGSNAVTHPAAKLLADYIDSPSGTLILEDLRIGRVRFGKIVIPSREAAFNAQDLINTACNKTARARSGKHGTRYSDPLPPGSPARLLSIEMEDYTKNQHRRFLKSGTIEDSMRTLRLLLLTCGDIPVSHIDHTHIDRMWDLLRWAPSAIFKDSELCKLSYEEVISRGQAMNVPGVSRATLDKHTRFLTTFFNRLVATRAIPSTPLAAMGKVKRDLTIDPKVRKAERFFDFEDLQRIFDPEHFAPWASKWPHRWWGPILGLYSGARVNEIAQLKRSDIVQEGGVWCIAIQPTVDEDLARNERIRTRQTVKGKSAIRRIPIHQTILDAGFLDYLEDLKATKHPRLFPNLSAGVNQTTGETNARYSQGLLNQFSAYMKQRGFPKGVGFHGFRHTLATNLRHARVPLEDIASITGHTARQEFPVLEKYTQTANPLERPRQLEALAIFQPPVTVPKYQRGQFKKQLGKDAKFYP